VVLHALGQYSNAAPDRGKNQRRRILWDMGRIAMSNNREAISLFRKILLASATLPGVFPPVRIHVRVGGKDYDELHVDGGIIFADSAGVP
jgi:hypothetical protein